MKKCTGRSGFRAVLMGAAVLGVCTQVRAEARTWVGLSGGAGLWSDANAWNPLGQPRGGDEAMILLPGANVTYANPDLPDVVLSRLTVGAATGLATLTVGQHTLNTSQLELGGVGNGAVVQSGGTINVLSPEGAIVGDRLLTIGSYSLSGQGQLNVAGQLIVGDLGLGTFTHAGGAVRVSDVGQLPGTVVLASNDTSAGTYTMTAGTVEAGVLQLSPFGGVATFNQSGGQVTLRQELMLGDPMVTGLAASALYDHNGGSLTTPLTSIGETGTLKHSGGIYRTGALVIDTTGTAGGGKLDVTNRNLVVDYSGNSPLETIRGYVRSGYAGGTWGGTGVMSSTAASTPGTSVGYAEASDVLGLSGAQTALWNGQVVDSTSILLDYTLAGDADLDGSVDFDDLSRLAQNYNDQSGTRVWSMGDFDHSGNVNFDDLSMLAQNYNTAMPAGAIPGAPLGFEGEMARAFAAVPEPGGLLIVGLAAAALGRRRRRTIRARF